MSVDAGVGIWFELSEKLDRIHRHQQDIKPIYKPVFGTLNTTSGGTFVVRLNELVPHGRIWNVLMLGAYSNDAHTSVPSAVVDWYAGFPADIQTPTHMSDVLIGGQAIPSTVVFSKDVQWAQPGEEIYAIVYSAPANSSLTFVANIAEFLLSARTATRTLRRGLWRVS